MYQNMVYVFTVCTANQYPFAQLLGQSLPADVRFGIGLVKGAIEAENVVLVEELGIPDFDQMQQRYDDAALVAACKPFFATYFLQQQGVQQVVYFDATTQLFGDMLPIVNALETADILLTPRLLRSMGSVAYGDEKSFLNTGMYDAGFVALQKSDNTLRFLQWWQTRLADRAFFDLCHGMNHDQLWLNLVPVYFDKVKIAKDEGWNVALHNLHERVMAARQSGWWVNGASPLLFFNFRECLNVAPLTRAILQKSGADVLVSQYARKAGIVPENPLFFSLQRRLNPAVPRWKRWLTAELRRVVAYIDTF